MSQRQAFVTGLGVTYFGYEIDYYIIYIFYIMPECIYINIFYNEYTPYFDYTVKKYFGDTSTSTSRRLSLLCNSATLLQELVV